MSRTAFFLGKGGVGKTTVSAATAFQLSREGERVLIISLDPAHNLGDVFGLKLANTLRPLGDNLDGIEVDLAFWVAEYLRQSRDEIRANYLYQNAINLETYVNILKYSPGTEEYAVLWAIEHAIREYGGRYGVIIFDTPPTALTLRFLAMPSITQMWVRELSRMRETILKKRQAILSINPDASVVQGAVDKRDDRIYTKLTGIAGRLGALHKLFAESYISVVVNPDSLSLTEALRIRTELGNLGAPIDSLCLNKGAPGGKDGEHRKRVEEEFGPCPVFVSPLVEGGIRGPQDLARIDVAGIKAGITGP
ncbi:MAG: ArsA family ATPase [Spirochaetaceae bacterium]|jgi:arsenite-transporting ATPase|nr:ArsA family ATPase [Spirochaetaceae bacterium]